MGKNLRVPGFCSGVILTFGLCFFVLFAFCACKSENNVSEEKSKLSVACYNAQTFFDSKTEGTEYSAFKQSDVWSEEKYKSRLERLCTVMKELDTDIFVLEEIENKAVMFDIFNQLADGSWNSSSLWLYAAFAKQDDNSIGVGLFSRYPLEKVRMHDLDVRTLSESQPKGRPVLEVSVNADGREIQLFVNHWKSKSSGAFDSAIWRACQEALLCSLIDGSQNYLALGDFNKDILEFPLTNEKGTFKVHLQGIKASADVFSPWLARDMTSGGEVPLTSDKGSYYYQGKWERIDHIFSGRELEIKNFSVSARSPWCDENGLPLAYNIYTGSGFSDHLPIMCNVYF